MNNCCYEKSLNFLIKLNFVDLLILINIVDTNFLKKIFFPLIHFLSKCIMILNTGWVSREPAVSVIYQKRAAQCLSKKQIWIRKQCFFPINIHTHIYIYFILKVVYMLICLNIYIAETYNMLRESSLEFFPPKQKFW